MRRRLVMGFLACLVAVPDLSWACPSPPIIRKPFAPYAGVHYSISTGFDPQARECMAQGLETWHSPTHTVEVNGTGVTNLLVLRVPQDAVPGAAEGPNALWSLQNMTFDAAGFVTSGQIWVPENIEQTVGFLEPGGCDRLRKLLAHELGHGMGLGHQSGGIMQEGDFELMYSGLDLLPNGPTHCDRDAENWARTFQGPDGTGGGLEYCNTNTYTDSHGCPCGAFFVNITPYTGQNHKPIVHVKWPPPGVYTPFSGTLDLHTDDVDGRVWRVDYLVNGSHLLTTTSPPFSLPFNVGPGSYRVEAVTYDNAQEYTISAPNQINVCGAPPPAPGWLSHTFNAPYVHLWWPNPAPGWVNLYAIEAGTSQGLANLGTWQTANLHLDVGPVGPGTYWVRVRAANPCGWSAPSQDIMVVVP